MPDIKHFDPDSTLDAVMRLFWRQGMAATGIQDIVTTAGVNRSSLYATFGGKRQLFLAALERYVERASRPVFDRLAAGDLGLPAIRQFFDRLIEVRCSGEQARWGCMVSNAHAGAEADDAEVRRILDRHHDELRGAMRAALLAARRRRQLRAHVDPEAAADALALLAYGVNIRSRAGADPDALRVTVDGALALLARPTTEEAEAT
jgi:AcrR family transcriptional regulator